MFAVAMSGYTPLPIVISEQQRIIRVDPGAPLTLSFGFRQLSLPIVQLSTAQHNALEGGAITHSVGQRDALKMNKSRAASISDVDGNQPEMRCGFLALPRGNRPAYAR